MKKKLYLGNCLEILPTLPANRIDTCITDPPYELGFMGKDWDSAGVSFQKETWEAAYRVLKPGGFLLAFGGTRTWHRIAVAIEDAGFEIRDTICWLYGQGFPKSYNIGKGIDKKAGKEREVIGINEDYLKRKPHGMKTDGATAYNYSKTQFETNANITAPATPEAELWEGWGTALKPSHEDIIVAQKPLELRTVLLYNIDRILYALTEALCQYKSHAKIVELNSKLSQVELKEESDIAVWDAVKSINTRGSLYALMDMLQSELGTNTNLNIVLSWLNILEEIYSRTNTCTTETALNLIIDLKTLNSLPLVDIFQNIIQGKETKPNGIQQNAYIVESLFNVAKLKLLIMDSLSVQENAISTEKGLELVPEFEPIIVAMKPIDETYVNNALTYGVAGMWIDGGRIPMKQNDFDAYKEKRKSFDSTIGSQVYGGNALLESKTKHQNRIETKGRWPANTLLSCSCDTGYLTGNVLFDILKIDEKEAICQSENLNLSVSNVENQKNQSGTIKEIKNWFSVVEPVNASILEKILGKMLEDTDKMDIGCSDEILEESINTSLSMFISGKSFTEKYLLDMKCTISTVREMITAWKICNVFHRANINHLLTKTINGIRGLKQVVLHDEDCPIRLLNEQTGILKSGKVKDGYIRGKSNHNIDYADAAEGTQLTGFGDSGGASRFFKDIKVDQNDFSMYNIDTELGGKSCGNTLENQKVVGMLNGAIREVEKYTQSVEQFLIGKKKTENFQKDMKLIISTLIKQMIELKTYNAYFAENIDYCMEESEKIIKLLMELSIEDVKDVENIKHLIIFKNELIALIRGIVRNVNETISENGDQIIENTGINTTETIEKENLNNRFFYCAKASKKERNAGLDDLEEKRIERREGNTRPSRKDGPITKDDKKWETRARNTHPTVKPLALMEYLCKLTRTPTGGIVIDPFMGSGTTGMACVNTDRNFIGIELDEESFEIAKRRIAHAKNILNPG